MTFPPLHLDETTSAAPEISPGTVRDEEWLLREILNPDHFRNGEIMPSAIPLKDLKERGFSVHRLLYVTRELVEESISEKLMRQFAGEDRISEGVALFTALAVRGIRDDGNRAFVVIDTAKPAHEGHASIYLSDVEVRDSLARRMRDGLRPLLENRMSVAEVFARS